MKYITCSRYFNTSHIHIFVRSKTADVLNLLRHLRYKLDPRAIVVSRYGWLKTSYGWLAG